MSAAVIKCENVYKIFGANAQKMLKEANGFVDDKGNVGAQQIADAYEAYVAALKGIK